MESNVKKAQNNSFYISSKEKNAASKFGKAFHDYIKNSQIQYNEIVIVCIGSDRATGDSLGPLTGSKLGEFGSLKAVKLYGTLERPVHAKNISRIVEIIKRNHSKALIVAVDASLGETDRIGFVKIGVGSLKPGAGVNKLLPPIGDFHITGIVNFSGVMEVIVLQTTKLSLVMKMADIISSGIFEALDMLDVR